MQLAGGERHVEQRTALAEGGARRVGGTVRGAEGDEALHDGGGDAPPRAADGALERDELERLRRMALPQREECVLRDVPQPVLPPAAEAGEEEGELALAGGAAELERRGQDDVREGLVLHLQPGNRERCATASRGLEVSRSRGLAVSRRGACLMSAPRKSLTARTGAPRQSSATQSATESCALCGDAACPACSVAAASAAEARSAALPREG